MSKEKVVSSKICVSGLKLTVARYVTPSGRTIEGRGIDPDVLVQARKGDEDAPLAAAAVRTPTRRSTRTRSSVTPGMYHFSSYGHVGATPVPTVAALSR